MKTIFHKSQMLITWLMVVATISACSLATTPIPTLTLTPTSTITIPPTSTFTPSPTATPQPTPTPRLISLIKDAVLYSGPGVDGYEKITSLKAGTNVEPLGKFADFILVRLYGTDNLQEGYVPLIMFNDVPSDLPELNVEQVPWKAIKTIGSEEKPIDKKNVSDSDWQTLRLAWNLKFPDAFEIMLNMESIGSNGIVLTSIQGGGDIWWKGTKRIEIFCGEGTLGINLRDGTSEDMAFTNDNDRPPMTISNGTTNCQIIIKFDQYAKNVKIFQEDKLIFMVTPEEVGDFKGGLFPDGKILTVDLSSSPKKNDQISSVKLIDLIFNIPPDGKYQIK